MDLLNLMKKRYSCKKFDGRPIEGDLLERILEAGRLAPTAKNNQPQHVYVLESPEALAAMDAASPCRYGAPVALVITYDKNNVYTYSDGVTESGMEDVTIVATHMMLQAAALGVDSCWINKYDRAALRQALQLPENEEDVLILDLGFAEEGTGPKPNHDVRKPLSETVTRR